MSVGVVVPTVGRPSLGELLRSLAAASGPLPDSVVLVDDRRTPDGPLAVDVPDVLRDRVHVCTSGGRGPAAARNVGWRHTRADWIAFLDDDVRVTATWSADLHQDLGRVRAGTAASQGRIRVPLPADRRATDWERNTAGLAHARWITADIAYRRRVLDEAGGFDERFRRAFREDADLALRVLAAGYSFEVGERITDHPVRPARWSVSVRMQAGNADDALMTALHGPDWPARAGAAIGRRPWHLATVAALATGGLAPRRALRAAGLAAWAALTADFAVRRIAPGPRTFREIAAMTATSIAIPPLAVLHWLRGVRRYRRVRPWQEIAVAAVLFDRDGTLIEDVPYNSDPSRVRPMRGARAALDRLRAAGLRLGVVSNQSGIERGLLTRPELEAVNDRVTELLGPFDTWHICPHEPESQCSCRKPSPGLVLAAAADLGVRPEHCVVVGDIGTDVAAATAAGAHAILIPTSVTRPDEVRSAPMVCRTLDAGVDRILAAGVR